MAAEQAHNGEIPADSPAGLDITSTVGGDKRGIDSVSDRVAARTRNTMRSLRMSSIGLELAISVLLGMFGGRWLDGKVGSPPWLMLAGIALGFTAGLRSVMRAMDRAAKTEGE